MVSSRLLCIECGTCEAEPYIEIDVDEDEDGKKALKSAIANVVSVHQSSAPLPVIDIRHCWHHVAFDGFIALLCSVPYISLFAGRYMWKNYLVSRWRLIFPPDHTWGQHLRHWIANEALMWLMLVDVVLGDIFSCDGTLFATAVNCDAKFAFLMLPGVTSLLLLRILEMQLLDVYAHVHYHKVKTRNQLEAAAVPDANGRYNKAMLFLDRLQRSFPETYARRTPPRNLQELYRSWDINATPTILYRMVWCSTLMLFIFLTWLQLAVRHGDNENRQVSEMKLTCSMEWVLLTTSLIKSYGAAVSWFHLVVNIICVSQGMNQNAQQLLLFSTLTSYSNVESWSRNDRESLRSILSNALSSNNNTGDNVITENQLRHALDHVMSLEKLDLTNVDDIQAWWDLRKYIQVDFLDESAAMDFCGVLTLQLIACFMFTGAFDWLANGDIFSPGILLVIMLVACLSVIMFTVIQAAININELLEKDSQVLVDAAADVIFSRQWNSGEVASLLHSIERRVAMMDDKQQILGYTMTATYRNGWVATFAAAGISSSVKILQNMRSDVTTGLTEYNEKLWNATGDFYTFVMGNETMS